MASTDFLRTPKRCYGIACVVPPCIEGHLQPQNGVRLIGRGTRSAFTLFELVIVVVIIGIVYGLFVQNIDLAMDPPEQRAGFEDLKKTLQTYQENDTVSLICTDRCEKCRIYKNNQGTKDGLSLRGEPRAYLLDQFENLEEIDFGEIFINEEFERVCFRFDVYPNGSGSHMVVEYQDQVYLFYPYFQETKMFESLGDAKAQILEDKKLLRE